MMRLCCSGEAQVEEDQAGLSAGRRGVLRRRHLEHLVRPWPHRGGPRHGQGTRLVVSICIFQFSPFKSHLLILCVSSCRSTASCSTGWSTCPGPSSGSPTWPSTCRGTSMTRLAPTRRTTCQWHTTSSYCFIPLKSVLWLKLIIVLLFSVPILATAVQEELVTGSASSGDASSAASTVKQDISESKTCCIKGKRNAQICFYCLLIAY